MGVAKQAILPGILDVIPCDCQLNLYRAIYLKGAVRGGEFSFCAVIGEAHTSMFETEQKLDRPHIKATTN